MRHTRKRIIGIVLGLTLIGALLVACTAPAAAPTAAPTKAPAAAPTTAPAAAPTTAPAAAPTKAPAAAEPTKPAAAPAPATKLGPMPQLPATTLQFAAGSVGGGWYALSAAMSDLVKQEVPNLQINVVPGAGIANHPRVVKNDVQLAMGFPSVAKALMEGVEPFQAADKSQDIRAVLSGLSVTFFTFTVAEEVPFNTFEEFIQKKYPLKIAMDRVGTTDEWVWRIALKHFGVTNDDLKKWGGSVTYVGYADQANNFKDKHIDAMWDNIAAPGPHIQDAMVSRKVKFIPLPESLRKELIEKGAWANRNIPAKVYGNDKEIASVGAVATIMTNPKVSDDVIYTFTRVLNENADKVRKMQASAEIFNPATAWKETGAALHPGAIKYFKEKGYMQ